MHPANKNTPAENEEIARHVARGHVLALSALNAKVKQHYMGVLARRESTRASSESAIVHSSRLAARHNALIAADQRDQAAAPLKAPLEGSLPPQRGSLVGHNHNEPLGPPTRGPVVGQGAPSKGPIRGAGGGGSCGQGSQFAAALTSAGLDTTNNACDVAPPDGYEYTSSVYVDIGAAVYARFGSGSNAPPYAGVILDMRGGASGVVDILIDWLPLQSERTHWVNIARVFPRNALVTWDNANSQYQRVVEAEFASEAARRSLHLGHSPMPSNAPLQQPLSSSSNHVASSAAAQDPRAAPSSRTGNTTTVRVYMHAQTTYVQVKYLSMYYA